MEFLEQRLRLELLEPAGELGLRSPTHPALCGRVCCRRSLYSSPALGLFAMGVPSSSLAQPHEQ